MVGYKQKEENISSIQITYLTIHNEVTKITLTHQKLLQILVNAKDNISTDKDKLVKNSYMLDDAIGYIYWMLGIEILLRIFVNR